MTMSRLRIPKKAQIRAIRLTDQKAKLFPTIKQAADECGVTETYVTQSLMFDHHISNQPDKWQPTTTRGTITSTPRPLFRFELYVPTEFTLVPNFNGLISVIFLRTNSYVNHIPLMLQRGFYDAPSEAYFSADVTAEPMDFPSAYAAYQFLGISRGTFYKRIREGSETDVVKDYFGNPWTIVVHREINSDKGSALKGGIKI